MPVPRWWWVCDAEPWSRIHATTDPIPEDPAPQLPDDDQPLSFEAHIKPLFRQRVRNDPAPVRAERLDDGCLRGS